MSTTIYSERLGAISDDQLAAASQRLNVGRFLRAAPTTGGLFGQNLFLTTTEGEFVLRGAPHWVNSKRHDQWQFRKELFFVELLHKHTCIPIAWPQLYDAESDIFGWPYLIMPRLKGQCFNDPELLKTLSSADQFAIARVLGQVLRDLRELDWPVAGEVDETCQFAPYPNGYVQHLASEIRIMAAASERHGAWTGADEEWINGVIAGAAELPTEGRATYVHGDFTLGNLLLSRDPEWVVSGIIDLHTSCFGHGAFDLCRQGCFYLDHDERLAHTFFESCCMEDAGSINPALLMLCLCNERIKIWEYFSRPEYRAEWTMSLTFQVFAGRYASPFREIPKGP